MDSVDDPYALAAALDESDGLGNDARELLETHVVSLASADPKALAAILGATGLGFSRTDTIAALLGTQQTRDLIARLTPSRDRPVAAFADMVWPLLPEDGRVYAGPAGQARFLLETAVGLRRVASGLTGLTRALLAAWEETGLSAQDLSDHIRNEIGQLPQGSLLSPGARLQVTAGLSPSPVSAGAKTPSAAEAQEAVAGMTDVAGLVLLAPYLPTYFSRLGLLDPAGTLTADAAPLAAQALRALAYGEGNAPDSPLSLFERLLLGVPRQRFDRSEPPPSEMVQLADTLLAAVVDRWSVLGKTSPDGLREAFLCRLGTVSEIDSRQYRLRVEDRPFDMLLDQLPWTLSPIRLRWMKGPIFVHWRENRQDG